MSPGVGEVGAVLSPTILRWALDMQRELDANSHKGDDGDWAFCEPEALWNDVMYHAAKMIYAMKHGDHAKVREFGADVANMAHMTVDAYYAAHPFSAQEGTHDR